MNSRERRRRERAEKYKHFRTPDGAKVIPLDPESVAALKTLEAEFEQKFGRKPGPGDPIFFDPDSDTPQAMNVQKVTDELAFTMVRAGIDPALIYAFRKTGLIVTEANEGKLLPEDLAEWHAAIDEYERSEKAGLQ